MKKLHSFLRRGDMNRRSLLKLELFGFGLMLCGIIVAFIGNSLGGSFGSAILLVGLACAALGGITAGLMIL